MKASTGIGSADITVTIPNTSLTKTVEVDQLNRAKITKLSGTPTISIVNDYVINGVRTKTTSSPVATLRFNVNESEYGKITNSFSIDFKTPAVYQNGLPCTVYTFGSVPGSMPSPVPVTSSTPIR